MTAELSLKPVNTHQEVSSQGATLDERGDSWTDSGRTRDAPERRADEKTTPRKRGRPARRCGSPRVVTRGRAGEATYRPIGSASSDGERVCFCTNFVSHFVRVFRNTNGITTKGARSGAGERTERGHHARDEEGPATIRRRNGRRIRRSSFDVTAS